jgi:hypothetical protein
MRNFKEQMEHCARRLARIRLTAEATQVLPIAANTQQEVGHHLSARKLERWEAINDLYGIGMNFLRDPEYSQEVGAMIVRHPGTSRAGLEHDGHGRLVVLGHVVMILLRTCCGRSRKRKDVSCRIKMATWPAYGPAGKTTV